MGRTIRLNPVRHEAPVCSDYEDLGALESLGVTVDPDLARAAVEETEQGVLRLEAEPALLVGV